MSKAKKILIVDDEEDLVWGIAKSLEKECGALEVECVLSGDDAWQLLEKARFDLVVSDIRMPGRSGLQLLMDIRQKYPQTKIIIMTAYGSEAIQTAVDKRGGFYYIEKPFDIGHLKQLILQALNLDKFGFKGYFYSAGIRELVEFNCTTKRTSSLMITRDKEKGNIYFKNGEIIHAECGELKGESALFNILNWSRGNFRMISKTFEIKRTILKDWKVLLYYYN
ncbi:MAG: response regulator [bacterium]